MANKKINKRGFLLGEETVKIIIAVICLVILIYFLFSLYQANKDRNLELAKASLEHLIADINSKKTETEIYNPKGWGIVSFSASEQKPKFCINKGWSSCLCICVDYFGWIYKPIDECNGEGACQENDFSIQGKLNSIEITPPLFLSINQKDKVISKTSG